VRAVHDLGLRAVLATSSSEQDLGPLLALLDIEDALFARTTKDDVDRSKPEPDIFRVALERGGVDPGRALVVGDSVWDVEAARATGLGCVAVESGGFSRHELAEAGAVHVYRDVQELADQLLTSPLALLRA
jgi:phosphoglycolate phosphatase-like HAD superfamily hydrolase